jgi:hypothetical protein
MPTLKQNVQLGIREMLKRFTDCKPAHIVCGDNNRVPLPPTNDYIIFTIMNPFRYGTPKERLIQKTVDGNTTYKWQSEQTYRINVQIDFYGDFAFDRANDIINVSRTEFLCSFLKQYGIQPIACDDAKHLTGISGEREWVERWTVDFEIDYCDAVSDSQDWFNTAELERFETEL